MDVDVDMDVDVGGRVPSDAVSLSVLFPAESVMSGKVYHV